MAGSTDGADEEAEAELATLQGEDRPVRVVRSEDEWDVVIIVASPPAARNRKSRRSSSSANR